MNQQCTSTVVSYLNQAVKEAFYVCKCLDYAIKRAQKQLAAIDKLHGLTTTCRVDKHSLEVLYELARNFITGTTLSECIVLLDELRSRFCPVFTPEEMDFIRLVYENFALLHDIKADAALDTPLLSTNEAILRHSSSLRDKGLFCSNHMPSPHLRRYIKLFHFDRVPRMECISTLEYGELAILSIGVHDKLVWAIDFADE